MPPQKPFSIDDFGVSGKTAPFSLDDFGVADKPSTQRLSVLEMGNQRVTSDAPDAEPSLVQRVVAMGQGAAHPQSLGDLLPLAIPAAGTVAVDAWRGMKSAVLEAAQEAPTLKSFPRTLLGNLWRDARETPIVGGQQVARQRAFNELPLHEQMKSLPTEAPVSVRGRLNEMLPDRTRSGGPIATGREAAGPPATRSESAISQPPTSTVIAPADVARLKKQGYTPELIDKLSKALTDDVNDVRHAVAAGKSPSDAISAVAEGSAHYADEVKQAFARSVKTEGVPIPDALRKLMKSPSLQGLPNETELAAEIAKRNATGKWPK